MQRHSIDTVSRALRTFYQDRRGNIAIIFAVSLLPLTLFAGATVDYGNSLRLAAKLQSAVDSATLYGAVTSLENRDAKAGQVFAANLSTAGLTGPLTSTFAVAQYAASGLPSVYAGEATLQVPTSIMKMAGLSTVSITRRARAAFGTGDGSCILTLGGELDLSDDTLTFNGAPKINLAGCTLRSNKSMKCNGGSTGAYASIAAGTVTNCPNPTSGAAVVPDIYAPLANNIAKKCGALSGGATWTPGAQPSGANVIAVARTGYREIHICGQLTLAGSGDLMGSAPTQDTVLVVENGPVLVQDNASLTALRTTVVLTGDTGVHQIQFPSGAGKKASLTVSSSVDDNNPWRGVAAYQDPRLASGAGVDMDWGPGASFTFDGVAYFPDAALLLRGIAKTGPSACSKIVSYSFRINGDVSLKQDATGCVGQKVSQYQTWPRLVQ